MKTLWQKHPDRKKSVPGEETGTTGDSWFYRFTTGEDRILDNQLVPYDLLVNLAQARMLLKTGIYNRDGFARVEAALLEAWGMSRRGGFMLGPDDEDVHSAVEKYLTDKAGEDGSRIHTGRSRNDQVLADIRLYLKDAIPDIADCWLSAVRRLCEIAESGRGVAFAGLTHTQPAMPHSVDAWAAGYMDLLCTDLRALWQAYQVIDQSPLGSAAGYGVPHITVDRQLLADELGFSRVQEPVAAAQLSRGRFEMQLVDALSYGALTFNRMASDVVLFMHPSWSLVMLSDDQVSGSSIMPQKRNPDAWELIRGAYHEFQSARTHLASVSANLVSGYHRDLQVIKKSVMAAIEQARRLGEAAGHALAGLEFDRKAAERSLTPELYATHEANRLVAGGMPFRDAYREVATKMQELPVENRNLHSRKQPKTTERHSENMEPKPETPKSRTGHKSGTQEPQEDVYHHSGAPGSGVPAYLLETMDDYEALIQLEKRKMEEMMARLVKKHRSENP